ncbi:MAG: protein translocase subunit SecF [Nanoarchaeota archaeon]
MGKRARRRLFGKQREETITEDDSIHEKPAEPVRREGQSFFGHLFEKKYKQLMIISLVILLISGGFIFVNYFVHGTWIQKDITLKGGISLTILSEQPLEADDVKLFFQEAHPDADISARKLSSAGRQIGFIIEAADVDDDALLGTAQAKFGQLNEDQLSIEIMGSSLGQSFFKETGLALIIAFLFMALVVFITFRNLVPSLFVILAAFSDIVSTFALTQFLGIKLSTAGIAAFLMLIGYSVDTDILLTTRLLREKEGSLYERTINAMKTGMTMSMTSIVAVFVGFLLSQSSTLKQIFLILFIGLLFDLIYTWLQNAGILRWYLEKHVKA